MQVSIDCPQVAPPAIGGLRDCDVRELVRTPAPAGGTAAPQTMMVRTLALSALPMLAAAHSNVLVPRPRNAVDALTDPRFGSCGVGKGCAPLNDGTGHCGYGASCGCVCVNGTEPCNIGQTCFWFSQGDTTSPSCNVWQACVLGLRTC